MSGFKIQQGDFAAMGDDDIAADNLIDAAPIGAFEQHVGQ